MSDYIVLVKQVPDVAQITDNAFDPESGNLMRGKLPSVVNELDAQALAFAAKMRRLEGGEGRIIALTMGPPMAEEVLRYSLGRGADEAVLLTDRALGGADTWATANPLAYAVRKIAAEMLEGSGDYYVVSGMQSVDGDTAQVPAQMAAELELPCVAYATDVAWEGRGFEFTRIISGGSQVVRPKRCPAVVTVAKYEHTLFPTVARTRWARKAELTVWGAEDVKATGVGVSGSKTRVIRVFPPAKTQRKCEHIDSPRVFAQRLLESYRKGGGNGEAAAEQAKRYVLPAKRGSKLDRSFEGTVKEREEFAFVAEQLERLGVQEPGQVTAAQKEAMLAAAKERGMKLGKKPLEDMLAGLEVTRPSYEGEVWVVAEHQDGEMHPATFELLGKARELAESLETQVGVIVAGEKVEHFAQDLIAAGADKVYVVEDGLLEPFEPAAAAKALGEVMERRRPQIVLFGATPQGRVVAPMISYRLGCGLTADCTGLDILDNSRKGDVAILMQTRPALGGNVMATIVTKDSWCQMATARPGVMKRLPADPARQGEVVREEVTLGEADRRTEIVRTEKASGSVNFDAEVIVSGGRGMQTRDSYETWTHKLSGALAEKLGAVVERGASRSAVEQGFVDRIHQVGQTGTAVGPKVYVALGISGAIQHMIGVASSETILAINRDPQAPILHQCDYYMVGDVEELVPQIIESLGDSE